MMVEKRSNNGMKYGGSADQEHRDSLSDGTETNNRFTCDFGYIQP